MRSLAISFFVVGLLTAPGCLIGPPPDEVIAPVVVSEASRARPPITPDSFDETNYRSIPQALSEEMDREEQRNLVK